LWLIETDVFQMPQLHKHLIVGGKADTIGMKFKDEMKHDAKRNNYNPIRHQKRLLIWSIIAATLFIFALTINYFRQQLFGIIPGYAPHNFGFNFIFFIPVTVTATLISYFVVGQTLLSWRRLNDQKRKLLTLLLTVPILTLFVVAVFRLFRQH
jgi:hypothetical protein